MGGLLAKGDMCFYFKLFYFFRGCIFGSPILEEQGECSGDSARLPPICPGFDSRTRRHMWVEFVVGSLLGSAGGVFLWVIQFIPLLKAYIPKFQFNPEMHGHFLNKFL